MEHAQPTTDCPIPPPAPPDASTSLPPLPSSPPPTQPPSVEPPLPMQTSSHETCEGLDIGHGGGGHSSTDSTEDSLKRKLNELPENADGTITDTSQQNSKKMCPYSATTSKGEETVNSSAESDYSSLSLRTEKENLQNGEGSHSPAKVEMEFDILDEFEANESEEEGNDSSSDSESDIPQEEIEAMLEEGLKANNNSLGVADEDDELAHEIKEKVVLKVKGHDHFDLLPEGWIEVTHNSGMPIYLHKASRVCSMSKPYYLGRGSARKHDIPLSAIPCLRYLKEKEKEENQQSNMDEDGSQDGEDIDGKEQILFSDGKENIRLPSAKLQSIQDTKASSSLDPVAVREYCKSRFEFETITVKRFKTWHGRRKHQKLTKRRGRPSLPDGTKLITCPLPPSPNKNSTGGNVSKREFIMNPCGKSPVCILHEYVQHTLRVQPKYVFKELENASNPYGAVVVIDDIEYGCGYGSSKKQAKSAAAKAALEILIPKIKSYALEGSSCDDQFQDLEFFDEIRIEDPRVSELCVKAGQLYPYQILLECLRRNYGMGDTQIKFETRNIKHQRNEFTMTVGKHTASVVCKNKRDGKQRASQAILQKLHPHVLTWGSLLRMYGKGSCKTLKEKKEEEQRITELQCKATVNKPNVSILNKLKEEMLKFRQMKEAMKPIGKFIPQEIDFLSTSDSNLNNVEL